MYVSRNGSTRKLLIVGCGGFVGSHLLDKLLPDSSVRIVGWDPDDHKIAHHLGRPNFSLYKQTLHDPTMLDRFCEEMVDADAIINLAALCNPAQYNTKPLSVIHSSFINSYRIVEACSAQRKRLIHFSTSEVYGRTIASYLPDNDYSNTDLYELREDETPLIMGPISNQRWTYACAKQLLERFIYAHHKEHGLTFTIVRPLNFFGPRMDFIPGRDGEGVPRVLACFMTALLDGEPMQLVDGGTAKRTIISIHDAIRAVILMLQQPERAANQIFNIGNRKNEVTIGELANLMRHTYAKITGNPAYKNHPIEAVSGEEFYGEGYEDCDRRMPNLDKAERLLGWIPQISLDEALTETVTHYYEAYGKKEEATMHAGVELSRARRSAKVLTTPA